MTPGRQLTRVRLIGVPTALWHRARLWFEGLLREFDILATDTGEETPRELLEFVADARERFSGFADQSTATMEEARRRGEEAVELELHLPPEVGPVARDLWVHIERAAAYCRAGDLLTLTPDEELNRYLDWYLHEVARQLEGESPRPWSPPSPPR